MISCGDVILMPAYGSMSLHLWIIVTDPSKDSGKAVAVNLTTRRAHSDLTVIARPSDHPWIKHESVVMYADARLIDTIGLERSIKTNPDDYLLQRKCSNAFLKKVQEGLLSSRFTPNKIASYCKQAWIL
jgi:hypothetical protein